MYTARQSREERLRMTKSLVWTFFLSIAYECRCAPTINNHIKDKSNEAQSFDTQQSGALYVEGNHFSLDYRKGSSFNIMFMTNH